MKLKSDILKINRTTCLALVIVGTATFAVVFGLFGGLFIQRHKIFPWHRLFNRAVIKMESFLLSPRIDDRIITNFVNLSIEAIEIPGDRTGGGMTTYRDMVLLLTGGGEIYRIENNNATRLEIEVPNYGRDEYVRASKEDYPDVPFSQNWFRYNDILYFEEEHAGSLLISYTNWNDADRCYTNRVARLRIDLELSNAESIVAQSDDWKIIYDSKPCLPLKDQNHTLEGNMAGGRMAYVGDHKVLLTNGDYYWDGLYAPKALAQSLDADYGKIMELDLKAGTARIISRGHRNPQGICVDPEGFVWSLEHGPRGGDELNRIMEGGDYGWPKATLGTNYDRSPWMSASQIGRHDMFVRPFFAWIPSIAASHCTWIVGFDRTWDGDLLVASLKSKTLYRLRIREDRVVFVEPVKIGQRIRYVHQHPDGHILLWTDDSRVLSIRASTLRDFSLFVDAALERNQIPAKIRTRVADAFNRCLECHEPEIDDNTMAPSLVNILGEPIASTNYDGYTDGLRSLSGTWDRQRLQEFLRDPPAFANGTTMPKTGLADEQVINGIVVILEEIKKSRKDIN